MIEIARELGPKSRSIHNLADFLFAARIRPGSQLTGTHRLTRVLYLEYAADRDAKT
jgi:hypothetical protein